jgi:hypothetical protein
MIPETVMRPDIVIPMLMSCALLWWLGRGMSWTARLVVAAVTLVIVIAVLVAERVLQ